MPRDELTKEGYNSLFPDKFQLTHYVIDIARKHIRNGNENLSTAHLLREIRKNPPKQKETIDE